MIKYDWPRSFDAESLVASRPIRRSGNTTLCVCLRVGGGGIHVSEGCEASNFLCLCPDTHSSYYSIKYKQFRSETPSLLTGEMKLKRNLGGEGVNNSQ